MSKWSKKQGGTQCSEAERVDLAFLRSEASATHHRHAAFPLSAQSRERGSAPLRQLYVLEGETVRWEYALQSYAIQIICLHSVSGHSTHKLLLFLL